MRAALALKALTCLVGVYLLGVNGQDPCCDCKDASCPPPPLNRSLDSVLATPSFFTTFVPAIPIFAGVDNICQTYFDLPDGTFLMVESTVYSNGFNTTDTYTIAQSSPGVFLVGSATCGKENTFFANINNGNCTDLLVTFTTYMSGECPFMSGNTIPVMGYSSVKRPISQNCLATVKEEISRQGVGSQDYFILPMRLNSTCVTQIPCTLKKN